METTTSTSNPAPILELPDDLDALDTLYKASRDRADRITCWFIADKVRNSGPLPGAQMRLWKERRQLAFCSLTDEERRTCHARL